MAERQLAVLIDYENVSLNPIQWLLDQLSDIGRVIVRRAYADWSSSASKRREQLLELGIEPVHLFRTTSSGKNASDIRLVVDAIDLLYQSPVDTFVIVSSDSDFLPLVNKLRAAGKAVMGAGPQATVSRTLVTSCDRYFYLDGSSSGVKPQSERTAVARDEIESLLVRATRAGMDDEGKVKGSKLSQTLRRLDPGFDFKALGYSSFVKFLAAFPVVKVTRPRDQGDVVVELANASQTVPTTAAESSNGARSPGNERRRGGRGRGGRSRGGRGESAGTGNGRGEQDRARREGQAHNEQERLLQEQREREEREEQEHLLQEQREQEKQVPAEAEGEQEGAHDGVTLERQDSRWAVAIDAAWSERADASGATIAGPVAAAAAASVLGVRRLSDSTYRTLQSLLEASETLSAHWLRQGNRIVRR